MQSASYDTEGLEVGVPFFCWFRYELIDWRVKYDRKYSIVDVETNTLITARQVPKVRWFHIQVPDKAY